MLRWLIIILVMLLGLYPIVELTNTIVFYWRHVDTGFIREGLAEIIMMWILYLSIIPLLKWRLK